MLDLIEFISGIADILYWRRIIAILIAVVFLYLGIPLLTNLSSSADFNGDLVLGLGCITLAISLLVGATRDKKKTE